MDRIVDAETRTESVDSGSAAIFEELLADQLELRTVAERLDATDDRIGTDELVDIVRHEPALEALLAGPKDRRELEAELGVSRATSHRLMRWLGEQGMATKIDGRFQLTGYGQSVAEELLRFERNVVTSARLAPLLESVCSDHQEFVLEPFADATVTTATPDDPYRPVNRFVSLAHESSTLRGFNTTHMIPLGMDALTGQLFEATETEIIYLPSVIETLFEAYPERAAEAVEQGHLRLRTREALPYGLAIFDDRVGIGGYDEQTGAMTVFVDSETAMAREWAERVYAVYRDRSEPLEE